MLCRRFVQTTRGPTTHTHTHPSGIAVGPSGVHPCLGAGMALQHPRPSSLHCRCRMAEDRPHATMPCPRSSGQAHGQQACPELRLTGKRPLCRRFIRTTRGPTLYSYCYSLSPASCPALAGRTADAGRKLLTTNSTESTAARLRACTASSPRGRSPRPPAPFADRERWRPARPPPPRRGRRGRRC